MFSCCCKGDKQLKTPLIVLDEEKIGWKKYEEFPQQEYYETINTGKRLRNKLRNPIRNDSN